MNIKFKGKSLYVELDGINTKDYPDFCDAFISYAEHEDGSEVSDDIYEELNNDSDLVHNLVFNKLY